MWQADHTNIGRKEASILEKRTWKLSFIKQGILYRKCFSGQTIQEEMKSSFSKQGILYVKCFSGQTFQEHSFTGSALGISQETLLRLSSRRHLKDPSKHSRKIKRVLKVKNSVEKLERFEKYREKVKKKAYDECEQYKRYPRSSVDGNELLRFYGTVMTCGERPAQVSELCRDPFCRVCRTIQSNFDTQHLRKNGIRLSTNSEEPCDTVVALTNKVKRAVIVCRTIAGRVGHMVDDGAFEECDSFTSGLHSNTGDLIVKTPSAVLPCFVIVFT